MGIRIKRRSVIEILILVFVVILFLPVYGNRESLLWITVALLCINLMIGFNDIKNRYTYVLFNVCFFTFLLGNVFFACLSNEKTLTGFSDSTIREMYICLSISLVCITVGMFFHEKVSVGFRLFKSPQMIGRGKREKVDHAYLISNMQIQIITIAFYATYPLYLLSIIERVLFVGDASYLAYYTVFSSHIPYFLIKIGELNLILFVLLFCVQYEKKKLLPPTIVFFFTSVLSLGIGQRNIFVLNTIMLGCCLSYANTRNINFTGQRMYSKRLIWFAAILLPIAISFLYAWGNYRQNPSENIELSGSIKNFFMSQGGQIEFFANTIEFKSQIWAQEVPYTFSSIYNYFRNLFGMIDFGTYTRENAMIGNSLGATQFYITSPGSLLTGRGAGCCYLSELYFDWGRVGVVFGSIFLGYMLRKLVIDEKNMPWVNAFILLMIRWIVYIPRASYFDWLSNAFNIWNVTIVVIIFNFEKLIRRNSS